MSTDIVAEGVAAEVVVTLPTVAGRAVLESVGSRRAVHLVRASISASFLFKRLSSELLMA